MTDYRVIHVHIAIADDRGEASARIERECDNAAREGWYLYTVVPDIREGSTSGMWLVFATADEDAHDDVPAVAVANEILTQASEGEARSTGA